MAKSARFVLSGVRGRHPQNFNWPVINNRERVVHITAAEVQAGTTASPVGSPSQKFVYHLGAANVWVSNVSPHGPNDHFAGEPGGVEFIVNVDSGSPLDVSVTITVEDDLPVTIDNGRF